MPFSIKNWNSVLAVSTLTPTRRLGRVKTGGPLVTMWCVVLVVIGVLFELRMVKSLYSLRIFENLLSALLIKSLISKFLVKLPL